MAQDQFPYPAGTPEADSLEAFRTRMFALPVLTQAPAPLSEYTLVWMEHHDGYSVFIQAVNDSTIAAVHAARMHLLGRGIDVPVFHGDRYAVVTVDIPVSMQNLTIYYYERR